MHLITSPFVSKPAPARVNRTARETGDRIAAMLACPDCDGDGCPSCTDDAPAFADQMLAVLEAERDEFHIPPADPDTFACWTHGYDAGCNGLPVETPIEYGPEQRAAFELGYGDGCEVWERECEEEAARLMEESREFPPHCYAGFGIDANEYEGR